MIVDIKIQQDDSGIWDFVLGENGDFENDESFNSSLTYAILGERRASSSEVLLSQNRRGWIGNENQNFENGSKLWLFEQARLTRSVLNDIQSSALDATQYFVDNGSAERITSQASLRNNSVILILQFFVSQSQVETRFFELWKNTGQR